ncbi:MAG: methyltransferase domain-containing protein [Nitrospiraceae bacterium]|nr:methyltransferase domain-containing protein [Nitrospiraceae bacterium]
MNTEEYATMYAVEDRLWWYVGLRGMIRQFWNRHVESPNPRVLDAGCGTGAVLQWLEGRAQPIGIDYAQEAVRFCRRRGQERTAAASVTALPFQDEAFDVAVSFDVLAHRSIEDRRGPLHEIRRVLKPGAPLLINLPAYQWLYSSHDVAVHTAHRFTKSETRALLRECGFEPIRGTYWNTLLLPPIILTRLWRRIVPHAGSDLDADWEGPSNELFKGVLRIERAWTHFMPLPFGLSVFVAARKR